jgi:hypothetical protein
VATTIDLRDTGVTYASPEPALGASVRWYDLFGGYHGEVCDSITWKTPSAEVSGEITEVGWEARPQPTYWMEVNITSITPA